MKKIRLLISFIFLLTIPLIYFEYNINKLHLNIIPTINEDMGMIKLNIEVLRFNKNVEAKEMSIKITNKYQKNEKMEKKLDPYEKGKYEVIYYPQYSSKYIINIHCKVNNKDLVYQKEIGN